MRISIGILALLCLLYSQASAFCGFYVAKAGASLFNRTSQVILVRQGNQTVITMQSDYEGNLEEFAMVVPVPGVLKRDQIRLAKSEVFEELDAFSGPKLVEYFDENPCYSPRIDEVVIMSDTMENTTEEGGEKLGVTVEAVYEIGEYSISILSATESNGLKKWLTQNGYKVPPKANQVLTPYIADGMKFFVVKVNLDAMQKADIQQLRPIQMTLRSEKFGLPIRLGMANAKSDQDMIVYAFSDQGRIEPTNYRNVEVPTDYDIPEFVEERFGTFYQHLFSKAWEEEGKNTVFTEYAWDLSADNFEKCDPCPFAPPTYHMLHETGVFWLEKGNNDPGASSDYNGNVFLTRMHIRYNRKTFPQDLTFQVTPNKEQMQARYVIRHPALSDYLACKEGKDYLTSLYTRRFEEMANLEVLTGWDEQGSFDSYISEVETCLRKNYLNPSWLESETSPKKDDSMPFWILLITCLACVYVYANSTFNTLNR